MCKELHVEVDAMNHTMYTECDVVKDMEMNISLHVYFVGSVCSFNTSCFTVHVQVTQYSWWHS